LATDASNGNALSGSPETDTFSVTTINTAPTAIVDLANTEEDNAALISVLVNDIDSDSDILVVTSIPTAPTSGTAIINPGDTTITYTPDTNFVGGDAFSYSIEDGFGGSDTALITVTVTPVNDVPVANDDTASTSEDTSASVNVLANDVDIENDTLSVFSVGAPQNGAAIINPDNTISYSPNTDFSGTDSFTYDVSDGNGGTPSATVTITVSAVNDAPVASDDTAVASEDIPVVIAVLTNDVDVDSSLVVVSVTPPTDGTASIDADNLTITYTSNANFDGVDTFDYIVSDGSLTDTGTVTITVSSANDPPAAVDDGSSTLEDTQVTVDVLSNDADIDLGDILSVISVTSPDNGAAAINSMDNTISYSPDLNFNGIDSFDYTISDSNGSTDAATVTVTVLANNDVPVGQNMNVKLDEDSEIVISLEGGDVDGDSLSFLIESSPLHGTLSNLDSSSGLATYKSEPDYNGDDSFTFLISDGNSNSTAATVSISVSPVPENDDDAGEEDDNNAEEEEARHNNNNRNNEDERRLVFDGRYFANNPSSRVQMRSFYLHDSDGDAIKQAKVGEAVDIRATIHNYQAIDQQYVFLVQVCNSDNVAMAILYSSGTIPDADATKVDIPWIPDQSGSYQIRIMIWTELSNPSPLTDLGMADLRVE
jgi:hypothetical protein